MIRVALAVALAAALLSASLPAIDSAASERTDARLDADVENFGRAVDDLASREDPVPGDAPGARRIVEIRISERSWADAPASATIRPVRGGRAGVIVAVAVDGRSPERRRLGGVPVSVPSGRIDLRGPGRHRLVLTLERREGSPAVVVRRART
ncbi:DUF7311 family protein [Halegenticoccus tardaugens]|uniref:DUF7311 family protein n=1 Tax=Halegenticoccus tardaugens TaxID=2071624 RepID=UPI00100A5392|nr:hypothetical protein [Halegenticoccus tardaugens]